MFTKKEVPEHVCFLKTPQPNEKIKVYVGDNKYYFGKVVRTVFKSYTLECIDALKEYVVVERTSEEYPIEETDYFYLENRVIDSRELE